MTLLPDVPDFLTEHPRLLFVTPHAFNRVSGGGITFNALFRGWPPDRIATVHNDPEPTTGDVCRNYFVLGPSELDYAWPLPLLRRLAGRGRARPDAGHGTPTAQEADALVARTPASPPSPSVNVLSGRLRRGTVALLGDGFPERACLTPSLEAWIAKFRPQLLYTILGSNGMMDMIEKIRRRFDLPMVVHVMDDWMSVRHRQGLLAPLLRAQMQAQIHSAMSNASLCLGISPAMEEAYRDRFGRSFEAFQNTIDTNLWAGLARKEISAGTPADILYVGSIFPDAQLESLVACCRAIAALNENGMPANLTLSSPSGHTERYRHRLEIHPSIRIVDTIRDDDAFFRRIAEADLLLLPVNFDAKSIAFIRYSMPTKVPAYLTAGAPILAFGPSETAQIAYAEREGWAFTVTDPNPDGLVTALRDALTNHEARARVMATARSVARQNHDAENVRSRFQARLASVANQTETAP